MKTSLIRETTWRSALRALCLGLVLLGFLPSLRAQQFGLFTYRQVDDTVEISGYPRDAVGAVEIPAVIDGLPVKGIVWGAFAGCKGLTTVTIPKGVTSIHGSAFYGCTGLESVTLPEGVTDIGDDTFAGCTGLTNVTIPSTVTFIGQLAFANCTGLTRVTIPSGVTTIDWGAFAGCTGLTRVNIPSSVRSIGYSAFFNCTSLAHIEVTSGGPVVNGNNLSIRLPGETEGLWCYAETSTDLIHWTTAGVTTSGPGPDGLRTASVPLDGSRCFLRVVVFPVDDPRVGV